MSKAGSQYRARAGNLARVLNRFSVLRYHALPRDDDDLKWMYGATDLVVPVIDDKPLFETLDDRWPGVPESWVLPPSRQWLGEPQFVEFGLPVVLDGSCGVAECCGVAARITVLSDTVTWDDLQSLNTTYPMHFEFVRAEYEAQLRDLPSVPVIDWVQTDDSAY